MPSSRVIGAAALLASAACVPREAGYAEVRELTAARLQKDARWYRHESEAATDERTQRLLAKPLDADAAVQLALLNNQGLQAAFEELGLARAELVQALRLPNPRVDAALRFPAGDGDDPALDVDALIGLTDLLFLPLQNGVARAELRASQLSVTGAVLDAAFEARVAFYQYQAALQTLELRRDILRALRASFEAAEALHQAGNITDLSWATERALYEEARLAYTNAEVNVRARREELNAGMGLWGRPGGEWTAVERLPPAAPPGPELAELEAYALERSLELALERQRFAAAAKRANLEQARGWVPELEAGVSVELEPESDGELSLGPAIALELPLFYQGQGEVGAARARMRQAQRRHADVAVRIRAAARAAAARLEAAAKTAEYYREVLLPLRQQIVEETQLQFNAMSVGVFQLLQAKRDQIETGRAYVETLLDYWTARARVDQLRSGRLPSTSVSPGTGRPGEPRAATGQAEDH